MMVKQAAALFSREASVLGLGIDLAARSQSEISPAGKIALKCYERQSCR